MARARTPTPVAPPPASTTPVPGGGAGAPAPGTRTKPKSTAGPFRKVAYVVWGVAALALVGYPLALLFRESLVTRDGSIGLGNYAEYVTDPGLLRAALNSFWVAGGTSVGSLLVAVPLAYLVSRTDMPGKGLFRSSAVLTFAAPSFIAAMGWILLLGPRGGLLNSPFQALFGLEEGPFDIFSPWGVIFVLVLFLYPLVFLPAVSALDNMEPPLEQAGASLGASRWTVFRRITLPLIGPGVLAGAMLVFVSSFIIFGPVALLGGPVGFETIPTAMLRLLRFPPRLEMAAVMGVPTLLVLAVLLWGQRKLFGARAFAIVGGKPGQRTLVELGRWRWVAAAAGGVVFVFSLVLPFGVLLLTSFRQSIGRPLGPDNLVLFENYQRVLAQSKAMTAFRNSLLLAAVSVVVGIVVALLAAWLVERNRSRVNAAIGPTMASPLAFPGAIMGIALILAYAPPPFGFGGTLVIILIAYIIRALPLSYVYIQAGLKQLGPEMEEASRSLGASWVTTFRRITLPLLRGSVLSVAMLVFVLNFRELESSIFLYTGTNAVVSVVLFDLASETLFQLMGAFSIIILAVNIGIVLLSYRLTRQGATP